MKVGEISSGRVDKVTNRAADDSVMSSFDYAYNNDGLRTQVEREDGTVIAYEYDNLNRLTSERKYDAVKGWALEFDGTDDYVTFVGDNPSLNGEQQMTVEMWIKPDDMETYQQPICMNGPVRIIINGGNFAATVYTSGDNDWDWLLSNEEFQAGEWYHVAAVYDDYVDRLELFVNGESQGTLTEDGTLLGTGVLLFGGASTGGSPATAQFFNGVLDEVRISNMARDVASLWDEGVYDHQLTADVDTVGLWHFDEGEGTVAYDAGTGGYDGNFGSGNSAPAWWGANNWSNIFDYDDAGNRQHWYRTIGTTTTTHTYTYNTLNQMETWSYTVSGYTFLHTFTYDANGNRVKDVETVNSNVNNTYVYRWNQDNQLIKYQHYARSGQDNILQKTVEYRYCRTCGGQRSERIEKDENGAIVEWLRYEMEGLNHWRIDEKYDGVDPADGIDAEDPFRIQRYYVNGPSQLGQIVKAHVYTYPNNQTNQSSADNDYFYGYDVLGNVSVISDGDGAEADQFEQDAFGNDVLENGNWTWENPVASITEHLTTKQFDSDLGPNGLYYFNARWYDPVTGTFGSTDPYSHVVPQSQRLCLTECCTNAHLPDRPKPSSLTRYAFVGNRPTMYVDPTGLTGILLSPLHILKGAAREACLCCAFFDIIGTQLSWWNLGYGNRGDTGQNAVLHCMVTCSIAKSCGQSCAAWRMDRREDPATLPGQMDLFNNSQGRLCAKTFKGWFNSFQKCLDCCKDKLAKSQLKCIDHGVLGFCHPESWYPPPGPLGVD